MTDPATAGWIVFTLAIAFTLVCLVFASDLNRDDLDQAQHELELDELWSDVERIEP